MRAHRELDDDVWQVKERLERHGNDLAAALGSSPDDGTFYEPGIPAGMGDDGAILGEREIIDSVLNVAAKAIEKVEADDPGTARWMTFGLELVTANVRQIRDLDDTVVGVCEAIDAHAGKLAIALSDFRKELEKMLEPPPKKGLFG